MVMELEERSNERARTTLFFNYPNETASDWRSQFGKAGGYYEEPFWQAN